MSYCNSINLICILIIKLNLSWQLISFGPIFWVEVLREIPTSKFPLQNVLQHWPQKGQFKNLRTSFTVYWQVFVAVVGGSSGQSILRTWALTRLGEIFCHAISHIYPIKNSHKNWFFFNTRLCVLYSMLLSQAVHSFFSYLGVLTMTSYRLTSSQFFHIENWIIY